MKKIYMLNNSQGVIRTLVGLKSRITSTKPLLTMLFMLVLGGWNSAVWGNTAASTNNNGVSNNTLTIGGNHATFYLSGNPISVYKSKCYSLGTVNKSSTREYTLTWTANGGCAISVTGIAFKIQAYNSNALTSSDGTVVFNGKTTSAGTIGDGWTQISETGTFNSGIKITCKNKQPNKWYGYPFDYYIKDISITYTITPDAPTMKATTATVNVSLTNESKLDMTTLIGVSDVTDFMPVSFESNSFTQTGEVGSAAGVFDGKYFYATQAGVYKYNNPYIASKENCHVKSNTKNGTITITVNRLAQSLTMKNSSVNVTTDKSNPVTLDLSKLINSHTGNGNVTYSLVSGPTSLSGDAAADNCKINGNNFYAWVGGVYTLRATAATTAQYNSTHKDFTVTVNRLTQTISWNTEESVFVEEDVISATSIGDVTLTKSGTGAEYISLDGDTATVDEVEANSSVTLTATAAQTDVYAQATDSKTITLTSLQKQHITFNQNLTKLKTTDDTKKVELVATSDSGRDSYITFAVDANAAGVSVTHEGDKWYLNYTATAVKGIAITASLAGVEGVSIAASDVSQMVKVTDPTAKCDITETLATAYGIKSTDKVYDLTIPKEVVLKVRCSEKSLALVKGYDIKFYNAQNQQVGSTQSFGGWDTDQYNTQDVKTRTFSNLDKNITKLVFTSNASKGYDITEASYTRWSYATPSESALTFEAQALSTVADQTFTLDYANYQIELSIEGSSNFVLKSEDSFGDCETYSSKTVKVGYNVPAVKCEESATLYIKDNAGNTLNTVTLNANVLGGLTQNITSTNIKMSYLTTDSAHLNATTDRGLTNFTYSALPAGVASFDGNVMTFSQSGTIAITVTEEGNATFNEATTTVNNVVVSKAVPNIATNPTGTAIPYLGTLNGSKLSGGAADITLRGVAHTDVPGSFAWTEPTHVVMDAEGSHNYSVTFTPTDGGMYTTKEFTIPITITRATQALAMNNGTVKVAVDGIDEGAADSYLDLNTLIIAAQTTSDVVNNVKRDGEVTYEVISANKAKASISGSTFSASVCDTYTIRATKAQTAYYNQVTADFTVTVEKRANTLVTAGPYTKYVDDEVETVATLINSDGTIHTSSSDATVAYYDIAENKIYIPNSAAKSFDKKEITIKIWQDATARFEGIAEANAKVITLTVKKYDNAFSCSWGSWIKKVNFEDVFDVNFTTNNNDFLHSPIVIEQTSGETIATLVQNDNIHNTITASYSRGDATWNLYQAENYKYKAATKTGVKVEVRVLSTECYLYEDNTEHTFSTAITDISGHFDQAVAISGPVKQISFDAKKDLVGANYFYAQYSVDNGANWRDIANPDLTDEYQTFGPYDFPELKATEKVTHIRFGAKTGATLEKYYTNVKVSRTTSIKPEDENGDLVETLVMPQNTIGGTTTAKFYMNYSSCDDVIKIASNNEHFTVDQPKIAVDQTNGYNHAEVTVSYTADAKGTHTGTITLYTKYQNRTFTVTGTTDKKVQTLEWQPGFEGDPMTLSVGLTVDNVNKAAVATSEKSVVYSTDNADVIKITLGGLGFEVVGEGTATLIASEAGDDYWFSVSDTITVNATYKKIQVIVWDQDLMRGIAPEDVIDLEAKVFIRNMSDGSLTEDATRTSHITYSCEANSVIALNGKKITVTGYGTATIIANVAGNETYEAAQPVTMYVKVRQPSTGCETPLVLDHSDNVQLFSMDMQLSGGFSDWTTPEITSEVILLDPANGKPDKLSYQHNGELYVKGLIKLCRGTVMAQQRVNGHWSDIEGSTYNNGGKEGSEGAYDWRLVEDLQLDENADAIRFRRLNAGQGYHNFKDIKITLKQYLRPTVEVVDLADIEIGEARKATIGFDFSDIKGDLLVDKSNPEDASYTIDSTIIIRDCGAHGHFDLPITITPTELGEWSANIIVTDNFTNLSTTLAVVANVTEGYKYVFSGGEGEDGMVWNEDGNWDDNNKPGATDPVVVNSDVIINGNVTVGSLTISDESTVTVTVTGSLTIGSGSSSLLGNYGNLHIEEGGKVNVGTGALLVNDLILDATLGTTSTSAASGQLKDENQKLVLMNNAYFQMSFDPSGQITYGWYDFVVPFEVDIPTGIFREGDLVNHLVPGVDFIVMEHSETARAAGQKDWKVTTGTMLPGRVYTITFDDEVVQNTFLFQKKQGSDLLASDSYQAVCSAGDSDKRGWNGLGNGTLQHKQMKTAGMKVQLYDHTNNVYVTREADYYIFAVGTSFFVQVNGEQEIEFANATNRAIMAPAREARTVNEFRLALKAEDAELAEDHMWISASEEATGEYTIGHDLLKMGTPTGSKVAQVWTTRDNMNLCDIEMPLNAGKAATNISLFTPTAGLYTLEIEKAPEDATLYLTKNGKAIWNLSMSPFEFDLTKGTTEGYGLRIVASEQTTTDIENGGLLNDENGVRKVLIDDQIYIVTPEGKMYDIVGKGVKF